MYILVLFEMVWAMISFFIAKNMVAKRSWFAEEMLIGPDDEQAIEELKKLARQIARTGKVEAMELPQEYETKIKVQEKCVTEVEIKATKTSVSWNLQDGWKTVNYAYTQKEAIANITFKLWLLQIALWFAGIGLWAIGSFATTL